MRTGGDNAAAAIEGVPPPEVALPEGDAWNDKDTTENNNLLGNFGQLFDDDPPFHEEPPLDEGPLEAPFEEEDLPQVQVQANEQGRVNAPDEGTPSSWEPPPEEEPTFEDLLDAMGRRGTPPDVAMRLRVLARLPEAILQQLADLDNLSLYEVKMLVTIAHHHAVLVNLGVEDAVEDLKRFKIAPRKKARRLRERREPSRVSARRTEGRHRSAGRDGRHQGGRRR